MADEAAGQMQQAGMAQLPDAALRGVLPFDMVGRYRIVADALHAARPYLASRLRVLDVGGLARTRRGEWILPARLFLPGDDVIVLDQEPCDCAGYVCGNGCALAFPDASFDVIISCDALEHVPAADRPSFWREMIRVARYGVVLTAPFATPEVIDAEELLMAYIRAELGVEQIQLREHRDNGRPDLVATLALLETAGMRARAFPSGYVHAWLAMMAAKHYLYSRSDDDELHERLDAYYTRFLSAHERREPAYRHVVVAGHAGAAWWDASCAALEGSIAPETIQAPAWPDLAGWLMPLLGFDPGSERPLTLAGATAAQLREITRLRAEVEQRAAQVADLERRAGWLEQQARDARNALAAVERGRVMRLLRWLHR